MSSLYSFEKYVEQANHWVQELSAELSMPEEKAKRIIRVTLQALRNQIPTTASFHLMAQLPIIWKGIYVDGWILSDRYERMHDMHDYLESIRSVDQKMAAYDFGNDEQATHTVMAVWKMMANHISKNELLQICDTLPKIIKSQIKKNLKITIL